MVLNPIRQAKKAEMAAMKVKSGKSYRRNCKKMLKKIRENEGAYNGE